VNIDHLFARRQDIKIKTYLKCSYPEEMNVELGNIHAEDADEET
jgi:hypothetical protein